MGNSYKKKRSSNDDVTNFDILTGEPFKVSGKVKGDILTANNKKQIKKKLSSTTSLDIRKSYAMLEQNELHNLQQRIINTQLPKDARREAEREFNRLMLTPPSSPEYGIINNYLEWIASIPWQKTMGAEINMQHARQILDEDHYDLDKVKDRIMEYLAVRKLCKERHISQEQADVSINAVLQPPPSSAATETSPPPNTELRAPSYGEPILCFIGPPGVGKTSLGQSIARALGRTFVRVSLGGVRDEAEIRGNRRTSVGAMPGRIIQALKRSGTCDPVFMLDEIDKMASDWRSDPAAALLEVLDPAQNHTFIDNYLGVGFDLTQVLFIATANDTYNIPEALLDRMEIIRLSGYTDDEKVHIAEMYLIPKQLTAHGLTSKEISFTANAIRTITRSYTREAGVRNLDREIAKICRKIARNVANGNQDIIKVTEKNLPQFLGRAQFFDEVAERTERAGVATGLAWTVTGGDLLFIEASLMPARDERLILTGMLGDVMRESAQAALSYIRANGHKFNIDPQLLEGKTIHLHIPAGAIPKDGPSAGVTIITALASIITGRTVRGDLAMTGEITLRGKVLPVGGIKEKVLAAHRSGIKTLILPKHNEEDLEDVSTELRKQLEFIFVNTVEEVIKHALSAETEVIETNAAATISEILTTATIEQVTDNKIAENTEEIIDDEKIAAKASVPNNKD